MKDRNGDPLKATGNCFENCGRYFVFESDAVDARLTLVHAIATGKGRIDGIEYAHAFLIMDCGDFELALDMTQSMTDPVVIPLDVFRAMGKIKNEIRYSKAEANKELARSGHWGPWDESVQTDVDRFCQQM